MHNFPTVMNPTDLSSALANSQLRETSTGGISFLKMDFESGEWSLGKEQEDVTGMHVLINTPTIQHGWILWSGGRPTKIMSPFTQPLPEQMPGVGEDFPSEGRAVQGAMMDTGAPLSFETSSYGGRKGVDSLLGAIKVHAAEGSAYLFPKIKLSSESYTNAKRGGKLVYNPIFEVVSWCNQEGEEEPGTVAQIGSSTTEAAAVTTAEPKKRKRRQRNAAA